MSEEEGYINITNDGGLKKKILNEGQGEKPIEGCRVCINYIEKLNNQIHQNKKITSIFKIGSNRVIKGWEIGIKTMKIGEKSCFILSPEYTNYHLKSPNITSRVNIKYEIELLKIEFPKQIYSQRTYNRGLSVDKKLTEDDKEKLKNNYKNKIKKIPIGNYDKKKYEYIKSKYATRKKEKNAQSLEKKYDTNYKKIKIKYGFNDYKNIKMKTYAPICDKCFRLIYLSFDFIKDFISTKCSYCNKFDIYKYDTFIEKLKCEKNPLIDSFCFKCLKIYQYSEKDFYLIEKSDYKFYVICQNCLKKVDFKEYQKILNLKELIEHNLTIYEKNKNLENLKNMEIEFLKNQNNLLIKIKEFKKYQEQLKLIETIIKNTTSSLRKQAEEKLIKLKKEIIIKNKIIELFNHYRNYIIGNNINALLTNILDFKCLKLLKEKKYNIKESYIIVQLFLKCEKFLELENLKKPIIFFEDYIITKTYLNPNNFIHNKKHPKSENFDLSYLNVININFETEETILYNILADYCFAEKITPIIYNYNRKQKSINEQEILIYNIKNDRYLYYGIYEIDYKDIIKESLIKLFDEPIINFKLICLNYGSDLFFIGEKINGEIIYFYLNDFRTNLNKIKYQIEGEINKNIEIINNELCVCIKAKQKLIMIAKNKKKELNFIDEIFDIVNIPIDYISNIDGSIFQNNNLFNNNILNINPMNNLNNMNNINPMNNLPNINNIDNMNMMNMNMNNMHNMNMNNMHNMNMNNMNHMNMNNMNHMNMNYINMNNMNNMNINNMNHMNNMHNMNHMNNMNINNMNHMNNNMNFNENFFNNMNFNMFNMLNNMNFLFNEDPNEKFENNKKGIKSYFRQIIKINEVYFLITSTNHIKNNNILIINYFYLSLFNFKELEEITKIELKQIDSNKIEKNIKIKRDKNIFIIDISYKQIAHSYNFLFKKGELIELK